MKEQAKAQFSFKNLGILFPALVSTCLWGSAFPAIKIGYKLLEINSADIFSQFLFAGTRFTGAGIMVLLFALLTGSKDLKPKREQWPGLILLALVNTTICYAFYYVGLSKTTGVRGSVLMGTASFFSVLFAHFFCQNERLTLQKLIGCVVGFSGIVLMAGSNLGGGFSFMGDGLLLLAAACNGTAFCISRNLSSQGSPLQITGTQLTIGGLLLVAISLFGAPSFTVTPAGMLLLLYLMFLSAAAFALWTALLKYHPVGRVVLYNFLVPLFGTILSGIFLKEEFLNLRFLAALLLVSLGIAVVNYVKSNTTHTTV